MYVHERQMTLDNSTFSPAARFIPQSIKHFAVCEYAFAVQHVRHSLSLSAQKDMRGIGLAGILGAKSS